MKDLKISYTLNGVLLRKAYDTIMDFVDTVSDRELAVKGIEAEFFENRIEHFSTLGDLKEHCKAIIQ